MNKAINPIIEGKLSHINARLADAMELLQHSTVTIKHSCHIISELEGEIEEIYLSMDGNGELTADDDNNQPVACEDETNI